MQSNKDQLNQALRNRVFKVAAIISLAVATVAVLLYSNGFDNNEPINEEAAEDTQAIGEESESSSVAISTSSSVKSTLNADIGPSALELTGPINEIVAQLQGVPASGDAAASFAIFHALYECYMREVGGGGWHQSIDCAGFDTDHVKAMDAYLLQAAELGHSGARLSYVGIAGREFETAEDIARNMESFVAYRNRATNYLVQESRSGNVDAMVTLAAAYQDGTLVEQDPISAYVYWSAAQRAGLQTSVDGILADIAATLTPEQIHAADQQAIELTNRCCG